MNRPRAGTVVVALAAIGLAVFVALPLAALLQRTPWRALASTATSPAVVGALRLSLVCSLSATAIAALFGIPLAWLLARGDLRGRAVVRGLVTLPLVLPPVVGGVALLLAFGRHGLAGQWLDRWFGLRLGFTTAGAVFAEAFVALPFMVLAVEGALAGMDLSYEEAAATSGAGRAATLFRVTIPMIAPSLLAGATLAWARALGEFGATITFAGSIRGRTQTLPLAVYAALDENPDAAIALSLILVVVALVVLVAVGRTVVSGRARESVAGAGR